MSSSFSSSPFHSSSSSCVPPRQQSTLSVAISAVRQSSTYQAPTLSTPTASNTNTLFLLLAFTGHGAELLKQETADPASNLRVILQAACEYDIVEMIRHLGISVHNIRAIGGAPATNLVIRQKFVDGGGATNHPGSGNRVTSSQSLFCGVMIRATSPQQCKAISISLKGAITNPYNYRHMQKLIGKVCRSRPTRLFGDVKARTPYFDSNNLFVSVCRMDEISQNVNNQPRWFVDFFASPSHMVHPSAVDRFLIDEETAQQRAKDMLITKRNGSSYQRDGTAYYVNYTSSAQRHQQQSSMTADEERFHRHRHQQESLLFNNSNSSLMISPKRNGNNHNSNTSGTILASDDDAMFVPMTMMSKRQQQNNNNNQYGASRMLTVDQVAAAAAEGEPIVLSRHYT